MLLCYNVGSWRHVVDYYQLHRLSVQLLGFYCDLCLRFGTVFDCNTQRSKQDSFNDGSTRIYGCAVRCRSETTWEVVHPCCFWNNVADSRLAGVFYFQKRKAAILRRHCKKVKRWVRNAFSKAIKERSSKIILRRARLNFCDQNHCRSIS